MFFILSMEADPKVDTCQKILKEKHSVMPVTLTEKKFGQIFGIFVKAQKGGPTSVKSPKKGSKFR